MSQVILITGSGTGIGFELARILAEKNHTVYIAARNESSGKASLATLHADGLLSAKFIYIDITKPDTIQSAFSAIAAAEGHLDVLVNNAGILGNVDQIGQAPSTMTIREVIETNFIGAVQTTNTFLPLLKKSEGAVVLNISSDLASNAFLSSVEGFPDLVAYAASKAALNSYTISLARALKADGINVNAASPGPTLTNMSKDLLKDAKSARAGAEVLLPYVFLGGKGGKTGKFFGATGDEFPW